MNCPNVWEKRVKVLIAGFFLYTTSLVGKTDFSEVEGGVMCGREEADLWICSV